MSAGRKSPVLLLKWKRPVDAQQTMWDQIREFHAEGDPFTVDDISDLCRIHRATVGTYLQCLLAGGIVVADGRDFTLAKDVGMHAPRLRADGSPVEQGKGRTAAWKGMRILRRFTTRELHNATGAAETDIKSFCIFLVKAGYLKFLVKGAGGKPSTFQLIKDSGPRAPQVTRMKFVFDPNTNSVTWPTAETVVETVVEGAP